ncbi:hypothetical protein F53441_11635 [Fusarium austroafricanum]|uniref:Sporulation-specific protein Sps2p n=1 Tax=Fusarium austroafricanum TaxID=2364996 RepID=A0A8H4K176_9HYPO|nr:hypothetical protein F53441_11635 [Fusarium austroafricanum]
MMPLAKGRSLACSAETTSTLTDKTQISSLAASCPTYTGDINIVNVTGEMSFTGFKTIIGGITYQNNFTEDYVTIQSSTLKNVTNSLIMYGAWNEDKKPAGWLHLSLPALRTIDSIQTQYGWGMVYFNTDSRLNISGDFIINPNSSLIYAREVYVNASSVRKIWINDLGFSSSASLYSSVQRVNADIYVARNKGLKRVLFDNLDFVDDAIDIRFNPDLDDMSLSVTDAGRLRANNNGRDAHLSVPNLKKLGGRVIPMYYNGDKREAGGIFQDLVNVSLPMLTEVHGDDLGFSEGKLNFTSNFFSELRLPQLVTANCTLGIDDNMALNDISLSRLSYVKYLEVHDNPRLLNFTSNLLKKAESINMTGSFTNVEFFSLEEVTGDFYIAGETSMDCSWFDEHLFNGIVKGTYKCVGNHTKPSTERKPSTPTDLADLEDGASDQEGPRSEKKGGLPTGAKAGIGAGVGVAGLILLGCGAGLLMGKKKNPPGMIAHSPNTGYQKAELNGDAKPPTGAKQVQSVETSEMQDTGKSELPGNSARAELAG